MSIRESTHVGIRERDHLYKLMISQLFYDGHQTLALQLSGAVKMTDACPPSDRLISLVANALKLEDESSSIMTDVIHPGAGIDLDFETERTGTSVQTSQYETVYVTSHKGPCRAGAFSPDGQLVATGSVDASIKILDVERMIAKGSGVAEAQEIAGQTDTHPVIRTLYDHMEEVSCVLFHPTELLLVSGSHDMTVKIYDYAKPSVKRALKSIQEAHVVRCLAFHPSGDYLLVGTQHPTLRLYDVNTAQCFVSAIPSDQHNGAITQINYSPNASMYVTASKDGDIRLWDGVSNRCINVFPRAHEGFELCSVVFSRNAKYVLSSGKDSMVKLWELSMSRCLIAYTGAGASGKQTHRAQACFNHTEDYVLFPDEKSMSLCCWDSRNAERQPLLSLGHNNAIRQFCHSLTQPAFLTCSDDYRARFWYRRPDNVNLS
ncbi:cleavage stimulation factor subunit 1-like [Oppia nitens]|uniref:cleavage stimulation factor subunit 1-like n=1 Tax=Oppia nitens TaxID=1686743 RepID=UPI0023DADC43|nr:cleavage stimulation factor subunit 1-like [Oppia nitens]